MSGGATKGPGGTFRFSATGGTYDIRSGAATVRYHGTVVLTYTGGRTVTLANPTVVMSAADSTLRADVAATAAGDAPATPGRTAAQAAIGDLKTYGIPPETSRQAMTWTQVPATLTAAGAQALPDAFEGNEMGPITWAGTLQTPAAGVRSDDRYGGRVDTDDPLGGAVCDPDRLRDRHADRHADRQRLGECVSGRDRHRLPITGAVRLR